MPCTKLSKETLRSFLRRLKAERSAASSARETRTASLTRSEIDRSLAAARRRRALWTSA
jgi:hypothetical protein